MSSERGEAPAQMPAEQNPPKAGNKDPNAPVPDQSLPQDQPPKGRGRNRGKDEEAREAAPGQEGKFEGDPNEYPDPENPEVSP